MNKEIQITTRPNTAQGEETPVRLRQIGERLREERRRLGISAAQLGTEVGVARNTQLRYEAGARMPDAAYLADLDAIGGDVTFVLTGRRSETTPAQLAQFLQRWALAEPALAHQVVTAIREGGGASVYFPKVAP